MDIKDKVVVVTGASGGIGLATARAAAAAGAKVVLAARSGDQLTELTEALRREGHEALAVPTDMRRQTEVTQLVEEADQTTGGDGSGHQG